MTSLLLWLAVTGFTICACVGAIDIYNLARREWRIYWTRRDLRKMFSSNKWP